MTKYVKVKTNRTTTGYVHAKCSRFMNYSTNRIEYAFRLYNDYQFFAHHKELREYVLEKHNVDIGDRKQFWGL